MIGREKELDQLEDLFNSQKAELVALYGRRRVGKTFLVNYFIQKIPNTISITGIKDGPVADQLEHFAEQFSSAFMGGIRIATPKLWKEAFDLISKQYDKIPKNKKMVVFFDELPWLCSKGSGFLSSFEHRWNTDWSRKNRIKVIVCGSAASWMLTNIVHAKGGLHNRLTDSMLIGPFGLPTFFEYFKPFSWSYTSVIQAYLIFGGIPFYLSLLKKNKSLSGNVNTLLFSKSGVLFEEFLKVFKSLYDYYEDHEKIVTALGRHHYGMTREELIAATGLQSGGTFKKRLYELEASGFIAEFIPLGNKKKNGMFRLSDEFTLFYLKWVAPKINSIKRLSDGNLWQGIINTPAWHSWSGYAFENLCLNNLNIILEGLKINTLISKVSAIRLKDLPAAQIDCLLERTDGTLHILEFKYNKQAQFVDQKLAMELIKKIRNLSEHTGKEVYLSLVSCVPYKKSLWEKEVIHSKISIQEILKITK